MSAHNVSEIINSETNNSEKEIDYEVDQRFEVLESKFCDQENTIELLNLTILNQQLEIEKLKKKIAEIINQLQSDKPNELGAIHQGPEIPPHY